MPRKGGITQNFKPTADATISDVIAALGGKSIADLNNQLDEVRQTLHMTHQGHELHLWDAEVQGEDVG